MSRRGNGEGSIYKRSDGRWVGQLPNGRYPNGRRRFVRVVRKTQAEVIEAMREARKHDVVPSRSMTVEAWLGHWLDNCQAPGIAAATEASYRSIVKIWLVPTIGRHKLCNLTPDHVRGMLRDLNEKGLQLSTQSKAHRVLGRALKVAGGDGLVTRNVVALTDGPDVSKQAKLDDKFSRAQVAKVLTAAAGDPWGAAAVLALRLGLRIGEVTALRWDDVDLDGTSDEANGGPVLHVRRSKTAAGVRTVPLLADVVASLKARRAQQAAERLACPSGLWADTGYVFTNARGGDVSPHVLRAWWYRLCKSAEVGRHRFHACRHTCATLLLDDGVKLEVVSAILGHQTLGITSDLYAKVTQDAQRRALRPRPDAAQVLRDAGVPDDVITAAFGSLPRASGDA